MDFSNSSDLMSILVLTAVVGGLLLFILLVVERL